MQPAGRVAYSQEYGTDPSPDFDDISPHAYVRFSPRSILL